jgi:hypothetical protein
MNLTNETIQQTYGNLLTIGDTAGTPTQGTLQNGGGQSVTSLTLDELQVNKLVQTQATIAASGTSLASATLLTAGVNLVTSADSNNISVKLPQPELGLVINVVNTSSRAITVYPYSATDSILGLNDGEGYSIPEDGQLYRIVCVQNPNVGVWSVSTPTVNNSVTKTVSINLTADGTHIGTNSESWSSQELLEASTTTYYPASGNVTILDAPSVNANSFDSPEFNNYNKVRIKNLVVKSNVPAGNLTSSASQITSTLMGISSTELYNMFGYIRIASYVGGSQFTTNEYNAYRFLETYSASVNNGFSTGNITHYMGSDGNLYQQISVPTPNATWRDTKDSNGNRSIYYGPYIGYGSSGTPYTGYPLGFSFEAELVVEFEFSM